MRVAKQAADLGSPSAASACQSRTGLRSLASVLPMAATNLLVLFRPVRFFGLFFFGLFFSLCHRFPRILGSREPPAAEEAQNTLVEVSPAAVVHSCHWTSFVDEETKLLMMMTIVGMKNDSEKKRKKKKKMLKKQQNDFEEKKSDDDDDSEEVFEKRLGQ